MQDYIFDGTPEGLLSAVFEYYERKPGAVRLTRSALYSQPLFAAPLTVITDAAKAQRVWKGLQNRLSSAWMKKVRSVFLSEDPEAERQLFSFICYIFDNPPGAADNFGHPAVQALTMCDRKVQRERHRMEAFVRFAKASDGIWYACISPDFDVLPLLVSHFRDRYADQAWIIFDEKRGYGIHYDLENVQEIWPGPAGSLSPATGSAIVPDSSEQLYVQLWKDYFKSTSIASRRNPALHLRHVPKRYWRYLTEKQ